MIDIILYIGTAQGVILSLILLTARRGNARANRILGIKTILFTFVIFSFLFRPEELTDICFLCIAVQHIFLIVSPLIFFYTTALTDPEVKFRAGHFICFVPFILLIAGYILNHYMLADTGLDKKEQTALTGSFAQSMTYLIIFVMMSFLILSFLKIKQYRKNIRNFFSSLHSVNLRWLQGIIIIYAVILIFSIIAQFLDNGYYTWGMMCILLSFFVYFMGYMGLKQPEIFSGITLSLMDRWSIDRKKYGKSTLTDERSNDILKRLIDLMENEKLYLDNELKLPALASRLEVSPHHLSQIINEKLNKNFFDFINRYRVEESKKMLTSEEYSHLNILAIGLEAGFNSNTTFISAFKRFEKVTPSGYRKKIL
ncbi:MAG: AraC family transcriptional regulator [Spirochaetes bacterium]|nr:AraC family transcriptional regulator [Spirochaetota bacterium]